MDVSALKGKRHLDVGCDTGSFLVAATRLLGTVPLGIDISRRSIAEAVERGIEAYCCTLENVPDDVNNLSIITAIDVVEHLTNPLEFFNQVNRRLKPGGVFYFETPNVGSAVYGLGKRFHSMSRGHPTWAYERLFPPEHIQYFSREGLQRVAAGAGLEIVRCFMRPLRFDEIAASITVRLAMQALRAVDQMRGSGILLCAIARRLTQ
jgi:SAM-dependent methyltransferase